MLSTYTDDTRQICPINITCIVKKIREKKLNSWGISEGPSYKLTLYTRKYERKNLTVGVSVRAHPISSPCKPSTYVTSTNVS